MSDTFPTPKQIAANERVLKLVNEGKNAKEIISALGQGGHLTLAGAVARLGLKPSKAGVTKGKYVAYDADTTFSS